MFADLTLNRTFAFGTNVQVAADLLAVAAASKTERAHFQGNWLQWDPRGDRQGTFHRPVLLIDVPRGKPSRGFFVECLVVPQSDAARTEQFSRYLGNASAQHELSHPLIRFPQVADLNERLIVE